MIFKSRQVNNDPMPNVLAFDTSVRLSDEDARWETRALVRAPRPQFEPTRDPEPYLYPDTYVRYSYQEFEPWMKVIWAPRREQFDTPVNRILVAFRDPGEIRFEPDTLQHRAVMFLVNPIMVERLVVPGATAEEREHARRVFTRLARL